MELQGKDSENMSQSFDDEKLVEDYYRELIFFTYNANFPMIHDFKKHGQFEWIELPIADNEEIPDELFEYIFSPSKFINLQWELMISLKKVLKSELNKLATYLKYDDFPDVEDFMDEGYFTKNDLVNMIKTGTIDKDIRNYIFGRHFDKNEITDQQKSEILERFSFYAYLLKLNV